MVPVETSVGTVARRLLLRVLIGLGVIALTVWLLIGPWFPTSPVGVFLTSAFYGEASAGAVWMIYMVIRCEKRPIPMVVLACLPFTFLWYYFDRVRPGKHLSRSPLH
jgi:hypothetical protein